MENGDNSTFLLICRCGLEIQLTAVQSFGVLQGKHLFSFMTVNNCDLIDLAPWTISHA